MYLKIGFLVVLLWLPPVLLAAELRYLGVTRCSNCHMEGGPSAVMEWSQGPHARAYQTLLSEKAKQIGASMSIVQPEASTQCLVCHVTAVAKTFQKHGSAPYTEGVGCEACHGAGQKYASYRVMKKLSNLKTRKPKLLRSYAKKVGFHVQGAEVCFQCHVKKRVYQGLSFLNPTYKPLDFETSLMKIKHWR